MPRSPQRAANRLLIPVLFPFPSKKQLISVDTATQIQNRMPRNHVKHTPECWAGDLSL